MVPLQGTIVHIPPQQVGPAGKFDKLCRLGGVFVGQFPWTVTFNSHQLRGDGRVLLLPRILSGISGPDDPPKPDYQPTSLKIYNSKPFFQKNGNENCKSKNLRSGIFTPKKKSEKNLPNPKKNGKHVFFCFHDFNPSISKRTSMAQFVLHVNFLPSAINKTTSLIEVLLPLWSFVGKQVVLRNPCWSVDVPFHYSNFLISKKILKYWGKYQRNKRHYINKNNRQQNDQHRLVHYIFGTRGRSFPDILACLGATGSKYFFGTGRSGLAIQSFLEVEGVLVGDNVALGGVHTLEPLMNKFAWEKVVFLGYLDQWLAYTYIIYIYFLYYTPGKLTLQWKQKQSFEDVYISYGKIVIFHLVMWVFGGVPSQKPTNFSLQKKKHVWFSRWEIRKESTRWDQQSVINGVMEPL